MRNPQKSGVWRAALIALAAGALVAVANPAPPIAHDASVALGSAADLASGAASFARNQIVVPVISRA